MTKKKTKTYTLQVKVVAIVDHEVEAENLIQAVELAKTVKDTDVITYEGSVNDSRVAIVGIFGGEDWDI